jgi:hypothetical protein
MRYYFYAVAAMIGMMFGIGMAEDPSLNLLYGIGVLYSSLGLLCYSLVRLVTRKHGY